jgi:toxin ParE1/3/4
VTGYRVEPAANAQLDHIYRYTQDHWGDAQAERYIRALFARFDEIQARALLSRPIPATIGVDGYYCRYQRHFIYWKRLSREEIAIVAILHERMQHGDLLRDAFAP